MKDLIPHVQDLLDSGCTDVCDQDLIVVGRYEYDALRRKLHELTGVWHGEPEGEE